MLRVDPMRQRLRTAVAAASLMVAAMAVLATTVLPAVQTPDTAARVDRLFAGWDSPDSPGCAMSAMRDGQIVLARGYGVANLECDIPITPASIFHVASVSKQFTAMAVGLLAADRTVSWDDDIRQYVPELPDLGRRITLRHLVHHTSGIRDQWNLLRMAGWRFEADVVTQEDVLDLVSRQTALNFEPGADYLYSNSGFTLLAVVVERVTGQSLRAFARERIFEPLGMTSTHFHDDHQMIVKNRAYAYEPEADGGYRVSIPDFDVVGATSLFTTVEDMARWDRNFYTGDVGGRDLLDQLHARGTLNGGADAGCRSQFVRFPDERLTIAVFCNVQSADPGRLAFGVADLFLPAPTSPAAANRTGEVNRSAASPNTGGAASAEPPGDFAGYYRRDASDVPLHLIVRQGELTLLAGGAGRPLRALGEHRFRLPGFGVATFEPGDADEPVTLRVSGPRAAVYTRSEPARPSAGERTDYAGTYDSAELAVQYTVREEDGRLVLWNRKLGRVPLTPTFRDGFYGEGFYFTFTRGADADVDGFTMSTARAWKVRFDKQ